MLWYGTYPGAPLALQPEATQQVPADGAELRRPILLRDTAAGRDSPNPVKKRPRQMVAGEGFVCTATSDVVAS